MAVQFSNPAVEQVEYRRELGHEPLVLVVDDDQDMCDFLTFILRTQGYRVSRARDGLEALEKAGNLHPDLIVMDLCLPRLDGCTAIRKLKSFEPTSQIPMLALTGYETFNGADDRAWNAGCDAFFTKPLEIERLVETIRLILNEKRH